MQSEHQFSNLVYEYFFMRIQFRYYKYGDCLPSIDTLCQEFSVSSQTVKMALQRLRMEGYIDMHNGRSTRIIFRQTPKDAEQCLLQYFSKRADSFCDLYDSTRMIIQPLLMEGFRRCGKEDRAYLARLAEGTSTDDVLHFFCFVLQRLDNPLAMNLYWETSLVWGLLFLKQDKEKDLSDVELMHEEMRRCVAFAEKEEWALLHEELQTFRQDSVGNAVRLLGQMITPAIEEAQIGFDWRIYTMDGRRSVTAWVPGSCTRSTWAATGMQHCCPPIRGWRNNTVSRSALSGGQSICSGSLASSGLSTGRGLRSLESERPVTCPTLTVLSSAAALPFSYSLLNCSPTPSNM